MQRRAGEQAGRTACAAEPLEHVLGRRGAIGVEPDNAVTEPVVSTGLLAQRARGGRGGGGAGAALGGVHDFEVKGFDEDGGEAGPGGD